MPRPVLPRTKETIETYLDEVLSGSRELYNVDYNDIKSILSNRLSEAHDVAQKVFLGVIGEDRSAHVDADYPKLNALYYAMPYPHTMPAFVKKLPKAVVEAKYQPALDAFRAFANEWTSVCSKLVAVKGKAIKGRKPVQTETVTPDQYKVLIAEKKQLQQKISYGRYTNGEKSHFRARVREINATLRTTDAMKVGTSPVTKAIAPLKADAVAHAVEYAKSWMAKRKAELAKADWCLETVAPRSTREMGVYQRKAADSLRDMYVRITSTDRKRTGTSYGDPVYVKASAEAEQREIEQVRKATEKLFDSFVLKMDHKIGDHDTAEVDGQIWLGCTVTITKAGVVEKWFTQQITNYTKYHDAYTQWPTRLMK